MEWATIGNKQILKLNLCAGCIEDLDEYNPYIYPDGRPVPRENIVITKTTIENCDNTKCVKE